ncbi:MAG: T9SS type A sorting domain-containing protein [Bacteroidetes bacterium]|nr:T9SS type A sorting domain-containing protein [Bacteroidota bacterium]MBU1116308.1 T9SS type A sorting domain-containing protein [Bacteroidota bacterium]MBU1799301.1 T9SS type A sorting domain-containing protein [Bacteroidota bacterium]
MTISKNETIYTQLIDNNNNTDFDIYMIKKVNGQYIQPERMSDNINSAHMDLGAFVDPDEQYIIFESNRPGTGGFSDLYISIKNSDGTWSESVNMGSNINTNFEEGSPYVSQDKKYFFFLSDRGGFRNPYWVDAKFISDMITDVKDNALVPNEVQLNQNYPNPFNPSTVISYSIPSRSNVSLKIYDLVGKEIASLVNKEQEAGAYQTKFDATELSSGIYFYKLITDYYSETKKMIFLK